MIDSLSTEIFKEFSKSEKVVFEQKEFETLNAKYGKLHVLKDKLAEKQSLESQLFNLQGQKVSLMEQLSSIGELPVEQPVSLAERYGWVQLTKQQNELKAQLTQVDYSINSTTASITAITTEVDSLKLEMEVM